MALSSMVAAIQQCFQGLVPDQDARAKIQPLEFVTALVFGLLQDPQNRSLASIRRIVMNITGKRISRGTFWERLATERLRRFLRRILEKMMEQQLKSSGVFKRLLKRLGVTTVYLLDSSSCSLPDDAQKEFPAPRNNVAPAAVKIHFLLDLFGGVMSWFELTPATTHDRKGFPPLEMFRGALIIFDLGYWDYYLMKDLMEAGAFFLSRVKSNATIQIVEVISGFCKDRYPGKYLLSCRLPERKSKVVELIGEIQSQGEAVLQARVIGFWNPIELSYHWYITNLAVPATWIYPLYRLRWQLELQFKACKGVLHLDEITTSNIRMIESLILATLIACLTSGLLSGAALQELPEEMRLAKSFQRSAMLLSHVGAVLVESICNGIKATTRQVIARIRLFILELVDPNYKNRDTSVQKLWKLSTQAVD